jgi:hypothetical protein
LTGATTNTSANTTDSDYVSGIGAAPTSSGSGGDGLIVISTP